MTRHVIGIILFGITLNAGCMSTTTLDADAAVDTVYCQDPDDGVPRAVRPPQPGEIEFSEIMADPGNGLDANAEWVELRVSDTVQGSIDLNGVILSRGALGTRSMSLWPIVDFPECMEFHADDHIVLANDELEFSLLNGAHDLNLYLSLDGEEDAIAEVEGYEVSPGSAWSRDFGSDQWCYSSATMHDGLPGAGDHGSPGEPNPECGLCWEIDEQSRAEQSRAIVPPDLDRLLITEFLADSPGRDERAEWFEVHVLPGEGSFDLNGLEIRTLDDSETIVDHRCLEVEEGADLVFAVGYELEDVTPYFILDASLELVNTDDEISLSTPLVPDGHTVEWMASQKEGISTSLDIRYYQLENTQADDPPWCFTADPSPGQPNGECPQ